MQKIITRFSEPCPSMPRGFYPFAKMADGQSVVLNGPKLEHKNFISAARMYWRRRGMKILSKSNENYAEVWLVGSY